MPPHALILASTSPYRRSLLERLGLSFEVVDPRVDESLAQARVRDPKRLAESLALSKALALEPLADGATVVGCDQVAAVDETILGKPGDATRARRQLAMLSGRDHRLITALVVRRGVQIFTHTDVTVLHMRDLDDAAIARYIEADRPLDCAGAYKLEARGIALFDRIESADHSSVTGIPLIALTTILRGLGFDIP